MGRPEGPGWEEQTQSFAHELEHDVLERLDVALVMGLEKTPGEAVTTCAPAPPSRRLEGVDSGLGPLSLQMDVSNEFKCAIGIKGWKGRNKLGQEGERRENRRLEGVNWGGRF